MFFRPQYPSLPQLNTLLLQSTSNCDPGQLLPRHSVHVFTKHVFTKQFFLCIICSPIFSVHLCSVKKKLCSPVSTNFFCVHLYSPNILCSPPKMSGKKQFFLSSRKGDRPSLGCEWENGPDWLQFDPGPGNRNTCDGLARAFPCLNQILCGWSDTPGILGTT